MLVRTVLHDPAPGNLSKFTNHLIAQAINSLLHLQVESKGFQSRMSASGPGCVKTRNFLDSGGASPLAHTEIVVYRRSSEAKFLDPNFIRSFHTAWAGSGHTVA